LLLSDLISALLFPLNYGVGDNFDLKIVPSVFQESIIIDVIAFNWLATLFWIFLLCQKIAKNGLKW
jgi:hypothetical protein